MGIELVGACVREDWGEVSEVIIHASVAHLEEGTSSVVQIVTYTPCHVIPHIPQTSSKDSDE